MKHHEEKMNEINDIIRELWRTTYRGNGKFCIFVFASFTQPWLGKYVLSIGRILLFPQYWPVVF